MICFSSFTSKDNVFDKCRKRFKLQFSINEVRGDSLIIRKVLAGNDDDEDSCERQLYSRLVTVC